MKTSPVDTTLDRVAVGAVVEVVAVKGEGALGRRLEDLGLWPGTAVQVVRRAPFGDPTEYRLRGYRLALRRDEAAQVSVRTP